MEPEVVNLLLKWLRRVKRSQLAHRLSAKNAQSSHFQIGIPAIALSTIVGTSVFASFQVDLPGGKLLVGLLSMAAAVLTALQTFLRYDETARNHQKADVGYGEVRQSIEHRLAFPLSESGLEDFCGLVREKIEKLNQESPLIDEKIWEKAKSHVKGDEASGNYIKLRSTTQAESPALGEDGLRSAG